MARQHKDQAKQFDIVDTAEFTTLIEDCLNTGKYDCVNPQMTANSILAQIQDWYLKAWKYKQQGVKTDQYADYLVAATRRVLAKNDQETPAASH